MVWYKSNVVDVGALAQNIMSTASGSLVHITDGADNIPVKSLVSQIVAVESGSGEKSPDNPYTISGFDSGVVSVCGVNLWDEQWEVGNYDVITGNKAINNSNIRCKNPIPCKPNTQFYFKCSDNSGILFYEKDGTYINYVTGNNRVITTPSNAWFICFYVTSGYSTTYNNDISINYPSTDTQYHAYNGNTYIFAFGQTVYGGYFDNKGNLVVTHIFGELIASSKNGNYFRATLSELGLPNIYDRNADLLCDRYAVADVTTTISNNNQITVYGEVGDPYAIRWVDLDYLNADVSTYNTAMASNKPKICYKLLEPITLAITSQDIPTLLGENNIFSNCGDVEVNYYNANANVIADLIRSL